MAWVKILKPQAPASAMPSTSSRLSTCAIARRTSILLADAATSKEPTIDATTLVLISAAAAVAVGGRFRVRRIRRLLSPRQKRTPWSAQGRLIGVIDEGIVGQPRGVPALWALIARDAFNGSLLWERPMPSWGSKAWGNKALRFFGGTMARRLVVDGDRLFCTVSRSKSRVTSESVSTVASASDWKAMIGGISSVCAMTETFIKERKMQDEPDKIRPVKIDDASLFLARFENGSLANFEATRYARGHKALYTLEINGEKASIAWDLHDLHRLSYFDHGDDSIVRWCLLRLFGNFALSIWLAPVCA